MSSRAVPAALPFWISLGLLPLAYLAATQGGWFLLSLPLGASLLFVIIDLMAGRDDKNADIETGDDALLWHRMITMIWPALQAVMLFGSIWHVARAGHLSLLEIWALSIGLGFISGAVGIVYAHELMHQRNRLERWLGDVLMSMVLYGHFRSEHLQVHHRYIGTPRDPVTARYGEGFYRFFVRVLWQSLISAFRAEKAMLARKNLPWHHRTNPFWRYWALELGFTVAAFALGGWLGLWMFATAAFTAVFYLELTNYIEHYGLTRKHLGDGKYEPVRPHHSWNADYRVSNWLLINLQRHSDHHYRPDRRYPLLQTYQPHEAPLLPAGYPLIVFVAAIPSLWRRLMNPRVRQWRSMYYPEITDWQPYKTASNPYPR